MKFIQITLLILTSVSLYAQQTNPLFNAFKQGSVDGGGNCASIALIKASISKYGIDSVFLDIKTENENYSVLLRSNEIIQLTKEEFNIVKLQNGFELKDSTEEAIQIYNFAQFCFAVMIKKNQAIEKISFSKSISDLNDGYDTKLVNQLLGLKFKKIKPKKASKLSDLNHLVIYNTYHAVYADLGIYDEAWNTSGINQIKNLKWKRFGWKCCYKMCSISGAYQIID